MDPTNQIFNFVPKIQVWGVDEENIELFWYPIKSAKRYKLYWSDSFTGTFSLLQTITNPRRRRTTNSPNRVNKPGVVRTIVDKADLTVSGAALGDSVYYFKATSVDQDGNESLLADVPPKPVFTILENRLKGRFFDRTGQTQLALTLNVNGTFNNNSIDIQYSLGRLGTAINISTDSTLKFKLNSLGSNEITLASGATFDLPMGEFDLSKVFFSGVSGSTPSVDLIISG